MSGLGGPKLSLIILASRSRSVLTRRWPIQISWASWNAASEGMKKLSRDWVIVESVLTMPTRIPTAAHPSARRGPVAVRAAQPGIPGEVLFLGHEDAVRMVNAVG
jgi:hypothetical protein